MSEHRNNTKQFAANTKSAGFFGVHFGVLLDTKKECPFGVNLVYARKGCSAVLVYCFGVKFGALWCDNARFLVLTGHRER